MSAELVAALASVVAGAIASVAGFGIGSILTPLFSLTLGTRLAVAAVSVPHLAATALRFLMLRKALDWRVLREFGLASAAGGLIGALLHSRSADPTLRTIFGCLLLLAAGSELLGLAQRAHLSRGGALLAGAVSGGFGGLVGNQGGIRSAAMLGLPLRRDAFVATATATGLSVDAVRMPVYFITTGGAILGAWRMVLAATIGAIVGTLIGRRLLAHIPERLFRRLVALLLIGLGLYMLATRSPAGRSLNPGTPTPASASR